MKRLPSAVALVALFCAAAVPAAAIPEARKVLCYWNSWAFYRTGKGKSTPQRLDTAPCTHMVYNIVGIRGAEVVLSDPWNDLSDNGGNGNLRRFTNLKNKKSQLKVLAAVGGQSLGSAPFSRMARSETHRKSFAESGVSFCKRYRLNGLVLNWNYPGGGGGRPEDKENFVELLKVLTSFITLVMVPAFLNDTWIIATESTPLRHAHGSRDWQSSTANAPLNLVALSSDPWIPSSSWEAPSSSTSTDAPVIKEQHPATALCGLGGCATTRSINPLFYTMQVLTSFITLVMVPAFLNDTWIIATESTPLRHAHGSRDWQSSTANAPLNLVALSSDPWIPSSSWEAPSSSTSTDAPVIKEQHPATALCGLGGCATTRSINPLFYTMQPLQSTASTSAAAAHSDGATELDTIDAHNDEELLVGFQHTLLWNE
ncbi:uncharacterized protein ISCGN_001794 [Ixodes scapularis]